MEEAAVAEKKEWLKEEDESELLQVSIALPQVQWQVLGVDITHSTLCWSVLCIGKCFVLLVTTMSQSEFIMGLADLTGELMRNAINSLATGNTEVKLLLILMDLFHNISSSGLLLSVGAFANFCGSIRQVGEERGSKGSWWQGWDFLTWCWMLNPNFFLGPSA